MNRIGTLAVILLVSSVAFAQQGGPRDLTGQSDTPDKTQGQLQRSVTTFYFVNLRNDVGLTDDQIVRSQRIITNFIGQRFQFANQRRALDVRQEQLLNQADATEADIQKLNEEVAKLDRDTGTWESRLINRLQTELGEKQQLTERQIAALRNYNRKFFNERLPMMIEQMRAGPPRGQQPRGAPGRPNQQNRRDQQPGGPANTLRPGTDAAPVQPRQKLAR